MHMLIFKYCGFNGPCIDIETFNTYNEAYYALLQLHIEWTEIGYCEGFAYIDNNCKKCEYCNITNEDDDNFCNDCFEGKYKKCKNRIHCNDCSLLMTHTCDECNLNKPSLLNGNLIMYTKYYEQKVELIQFHPNDDGTFKMTDIR